MTWQDQDRINRLRRIGEIHAEWSAEHAADTPPPPEDVSDGSEHHVDLDGRHDADFLARLAAEGLEMPTPR